MPYLSIYGGPLHKLCTNIYTPPKRVSVMGSAASHSEKVSFWLIAIGSICLTLKEPTYVFGFGTLSNNIHIFETLLFTHMQGAIIYISVWFLCVSPGAFIL